MPQAGDSYEWRVVIWNDSIRTQPLDLAGFEVKAEIREQTGARRAWPLRCIVTLPNIIDVELLPSLSRDLPANGVWDLQLTTRGGHVATILRGDVTVVADVTDSTGLGEDIVTPHRLVAIPKRGVRL